MNGSISQKKSSVNYADIRNYLDLNVTDARSIKITTIDTNKLDEGGKKNLIYIKQPKGLSSCLCLKQNSSKPKGNKNCALF